MSFKYPFFQPFFIFIKRQVPVFGSFHDWLFSAQCGMRVDQFRRAECGAAVFTLIPISIFISAFWAGPHNIPVSKKLLCFYIKILLCYFFFKSSFFIECFEIF